MARPQSLALPTIVRASQQKGAERESGERRVIKSVDLCCQSKMKRYLGIWELRCIGEVCWMGLR